MSELTTTAELRKRMLQLWEKVDRGEISAQDCRVQIGLARAIMDTLKVEIAAAHVNMDVIPPVPLNQRRIGNARRMA